MKSARVVLAATVAAVAVAAAGVATVDALASEPTKPVRAAATFDPNAPHDFPDRPVRDDLPIQKIAAEAGLGRADYGRIAQCGMFATWRIDSNLGRPDMTTVSQLSGVPAANMDDVAEAVGLRVDHRAAVGAVGVMDLGYNGASKVWGHAFYVARIFTDGSLLIEQYNEAGHGEYSTAHVPASWASAYIHFR